MGIAPNGGDYNEYINMDVHDNGTNDFEHGFYQTASHVLIERSRIYRNSGWGITNHHNSDDPIPGPSYNIYRNNLIYDNARVGPRGAGIGIYSASGEPSTNNLIYNNIIWGNNLGIVTNNRSEGAKIFNNTVYGNTSQGIHIGGTFGGSHNTLVKNNIVYSTVVIWGSDTGSCGNDTPLFGK
jgi:nitrous oxidase accessory protein NosD